MSESSASTRALAARVYRRHPGAFAAIIGLAVAAMVLEGFGLTLVLPIIEGLDSRDAVTADHPVSQGIGTLLSSLGIPFTLWSLFAVGFGTYFLLAVVTYLRADLVSRTGARFVTELRAELFRDLMEAQIGYFHRRKVGDLANVAILEADRARAAFHFLIDGIVGALLLLVYLGASVLISWRLFAVTAVFGAVFVLLTRRRRSTHTKGRDISRANDLLQSRTVEFLVGIREVKVFGLEGRASDTFVDAAGSAAREGWHLNRLTARLRLAYDAVAVAMLLAVIGISFFVVRSPPAELAAFLLVVFRLLPRLTGAQSSWDNLLGTVPGFEAVERLRSDARALHAPSVDDPASAVNLTSTLALENVSFVYPGRPDPALTDVTFSIPRGKTVALVGASGAGKSTLVDLIIRFHDPTAGRITVDGRDLREIDLRAWRASIGYVSQDSFLFHDTILENIRIARPDATEHEVLEAAQAAHAAEFIAEAPQGYATVVGDRGSTLSGGQRQRIALARAYLRRPDILILDEPTSDLDSRSERIVQESLDGLRKGRTVIIIAHRLATIQDADLIVLLEQGRVVETGTHAELLARKGGYAQYVAFQAAGRGGA